VGNAVVFATTALLTTTALEATSALGISGPWPQVSAIVAGTLLAALVRFVVLKAWVFRTHASVTNVATGPERHHPQ
jgi:hypothetical protein